MTTSFGPSDRVRVIATGEAGFICGFSHSGAVLVCLESGAIVEYLEHEVAADTAERDDERS